MSGLPEIATWAVLGVAIITNVTGIVVAFIKRKVPEAQSVTEKADAQAKFVANVIAHNGELTGEIRALRAEYHGYISQVQSDKKETEVNTARLEREITKLARRVALTEVETNGNGGH